MNKKKKTAKKHLHIRALCLSALIVYLLGAIICQEFSLREDSRRIAALQKEIDEANASLVAVQDLEELSRSDAYIERVAREKLGLILPDEVVFVDVTGR